MCSTHIFKWITLTQRYLFKLLCFSIYLREQGVSLLSLISSVLFGPLYQTAMNIAKYEFNRFFMVRLVTVYTYIIDLCTCIWTPLLHPSPNLDPSFLYLPLLSLLYKSCSLFEFDIFSFLTISSIILSFTHAIARSIHSTYPVLPHNICYIVIRYECKYLQILFHIIVGGSIKILKQRNYNTAMHKLFKHSY